MALVKAYLGIDSLSVDLNFYSRYFYDDEFYDNVNFQYGGRTYEDAYLINGYDGSVDLVLAFLGYGIGFDSAGRANRGTVTALAEGTYSGHDIWDIQGISVPASRLNSVASTYSNTDDRALIGSALSGNDTIQLSAYDDRFEGWGGNDRMFGGGGNDTLLGGDGNDTLQGGYGNDVLNGGVGRDHMTGGQGDDIYFVTAGDITVEQAGGGIDRVNSATNWNLSAHTEHLILTGSANSTGGGNNLANHIHGNSGNNILHGGAGDDSIFGNAGNDHIVGGSGNDTLKGGNGADALNGGLGRDVIYGGGGQARDVFIFNSALDSRVGVQRDQLFEFEPGRDDINLSGIDANNRLAGNQALDFSGTQADEYSVWFVRQTGGVIVRADVNGDRSADFEIWVNGAARLSVSDFLL